MRGYSRKPAAIILLLAGLAGGAWGGVRVLTHRQTRLPALDELERTVARAEASTETWLAYAQRLREAGRFPHAAAAYRKVLEDDPANKPAQIGCALALAAAGQTAPLHSFLIDLTGHEPALVLEILQLPACQRCLPEATLTTLQNEARMQMMD